MEAKTEITMKEIQLQQRERLTIDKIVMNEYPQGYEVNMFPISIEEQMMMKGGNVPGWISTVWNWVRELFQSGDGSPTILSPTINVDRSTNVKGDTKNIGIVIYAEDSQVTIEEKLQAIYNTFGRPNSITIGEMVKCFRPYPYD